MSEQNETRHDSAGAETHGASNSSKAHSSTKPRGAARFSDWLNTLGPLLALACVIGLFALADRVWADGTFATGRNLRTVTVQTCVVAVAALGMTIIIISGGIDLSAGTALAMCATTLAWGLREDVAFYARHGDTFAKASARFDESQKKLASAKRAGGADVAQLAELAQKRRDALRVLLAAKRRAAESGASAAAQEALDKKIQKLDNPEFVLASDARWLDGVPNSGWTPLVSVLIGILTGVVAGLCNGLAIGTLRIVPFVVTLGTMTIFLGLGNLLSNNVPIRPSLAQIPAWIADLDGNTPDALWLGFPTGVWLVLVFAAVVALMLHFTVFGRYVFALGSNEATARLCGINVTANKIAIYGLAGLFFGIAGVYQFTRLSTGAPMSGAGLELEIIAAVVIGGGSLNGGRGTVLGTLAGAAMTAVIKSGCTQLQLADALQRIILGAIIIAAVTIDQLRQRRAKGV